MAGYKPLYISGMETGLVQSRQEFILPNDAYPVLENAFIWRERIKRKQGCKILGRLRRVFTTQSLGNSAVSPWTINTIYSTLVPPITPESTAEIEPGSVVITVGAIVFTDQGDGTLTSPALGNSGTINYRTGVVVLTHTAGAGAVTTIDFNYFPGLPVMGLRSRELNAINAEQTIAFDTVYAYRFQGAGWQEFITGTTWTGSNSQFFWSTNYWVSDANIKVFWVTNFNDPIRYTNGSAWIDFSPTINSAGDLLENTLVMLPFRGRLVIGNTIEQGNTYPNRIRWSAIGTPFSDVSAIVTTVNADAWKDDIRGQGGYLDIPTSESIISFGYVRDNLVVFCEHSTWQLRYTGRSIAPFQIERVNSELGSESTFSAVQFDTSLIGIGDKGIVECDSYKSERIDIKIPQLVFDFNNLNEGPSRVHGIRDFISKLAFWTYPYLAAETDAPYDIVFPNRRLIYNYENDSWAIFTDSFTALGTFQPQSGLKWEDFPGPDATDKWSYQNVSWIQRQPLAPDIIGGNQQGFVEYLDVQVSNDVSLVISDIEGGLDTVKITSYDHNLVDDQVIQLFSISSTDPFFALTNGIYGVSIEDEDTFYIYTYNSVTDDFDGAVVIADGDYIGGGRIAIRDGFSVVSKKFNALEAGQNIQLGFIDVLLNNTSNGAITCNIYLDYNDSTPINRSTENQQVDTFFNSIVPTTQDGNLEVSKNWKRVFCAARGSFITIQWTLSNAQLVGEEQGCDVQIDSQILWTRAAGRQLPIGV
jgi:hypothetical protein